VEDFTAEAQRGRESKASESEEEKSGGKEEATPFFNLFPSLLCVTLRSLRLCGE
jgi:hypothetical protein